MSNDLSVIDLGGQATATEAKPRQMGEQSARKASGFERAAIKEATFGGGAVVVRGIVASANVWREGSKVRRNTDGTAIGSITANGEEQDIPDPGETLEIPGVATFQTVITDRTRNGISVTALRVTLLDGTGAVIDLGQAELKIVGSGR